MIISKNNESLMTLPFDLYIRNRIAADLINSISKFGLEILDVGGREGRLYQFLEGHRVSILDIREPENTKKDDRYFLGSILSAPFPSNSFDVVVSMDMLEHLSPKDRIKAIEEMIRISKIGIIVGAPFETTSVAEIEELANQYFKHLTGKDHMWLKEHIEKRPLPDITEIEDYFKGHHLRFIKIQHNNLFLWYIMQSFIFLAYKSALASQMVEAVYKFYNLNWKEIGDLDSPCYRHIFFGVKNQSVDIEMFRQVISLYYRETSKSKELLQSQLINLIEQAKTGISNPNEINISLSRRVIKYLKREGIIKMIKKIMEKIKVVGMKMHNTNSPTIFPESALAHKYCLGKGLEIGGSAHNPFGLNTLNVDISDSMDTMFKQEEIKLCGRALKVDIVAHGDNIPLPDESQDFIVSSHVLEHFPNPIKALIEWDRLIRPGGIIFMIVPHKERTFDKDKDRTSLSHIVEDFYTNNTGTTDNPHGHYHYWITEDIVVLINMMIDNLMIKWEILEVQDVDDKVGNGFTIVIRKKNQ